LAHAQFHVADLPGSLLGWTYQQNIWIDAHAAGYGWFLDAAAGSIAAFALVAGAGELATAAAASPAYGHVDLLTVVTHELAHILGLNDDQGIDWMGEYLPTGIRRLPSAAISGVMARASVVVTESVTPTAPATPAAVGRALPGSARLLPSRTATSAIPARLDAGSAPGYAITSGSLAPPLYHDRATTKPADPVAISIDQLMSRANFRLRARVKRTLWNLFDGPIT
jgi:hypothetical protein